MHFSNKHIEILNRAKEEINYNFGISGTYKYLSDVSTNTEMRRNAREEREYRNELRRQKELENPQTLFLYNAKILRLKRLINEVIKFFNKKGIFDSTNVKLIEEFEEKIPEIQKLIEQDKIEKAEEVIDRLNRKVEKVRLYNKL